MLMPKEHSLYRGFLSLPLRWRKENIVFVLIIVIMILIGCQAAEAEPTPIPGGVAAEDLIGVWGQDNCNLCIEFLENGTYRLADSTDGLDLAKPPPPLDGGWFQVEGSLITFRSSDQSPLCPGESGSYQIELTEQDQLKLELNEDSCEDRAKNTPRQPFGRVSP